MLLLHEIRSEGWRFILNIWPSFVDEQAWRLIIYYATFELLLMRLLPGNTFLATKTAMGHQPVYKANGMLSFITTLVTYILLVAAGWDSGIVYDKIGEILSGLCIFSLFFCLALYFKGLYFPSTVDSGTNGAGFIKDYYWGTELYPRFLGWDIKQFTNCRFGMMFWAVGLLCYAHHQIREFGFISDSMAVSVTLQLVYIAKFFYWEMGYMCSMDIQHDRSGYYICWGCLVWVPSVYTSAGMYLTRHPVQLGTSLSLVILIVGILCIWANYDADRQRQHFRAVNGKCIIWGKMAKSITAEYKNAKGGTSTSLLLCSGWWGVSRHFHYVTEVSAAFCWSLPALFTHLSPYFYVIFLVVLLVDRSFRDDVRCRGKYGKDWDRYCKIVPYKIIPYVL
jgi:7-dehydrocholesterol reductase